jgi:hypothetical protein
MLLFVKESIDIYQVNFFSFASCAEKAVLIQENILPTYSP